MQSRSRVVLEPMGKAWFSMVMVHVSIAAFAWYGLVNGPRTEGAAAPGKSLPVASREEALVWRSPADFRKADGRVGTEEKHPEESTDGESPEEGDPVSAAMPKAPTVAESASMTATVPPPAADAPRKAADRPGNRFITLLRLTSDLAEPPGAVRSVLPGGPVPILLDVARMEARPVIPQAGQGGAASSQSGLDEVDAAVQEAFMQNWVAPSITDVDPSRRTARLEVTVGRDGSVVSTLLFQPSGSRPMDVSILEAAKKVQKIAVSLPAGFANSFYQLQVNFQID